MENSDLQSTVSTSDPWQKGFAFSAGAVVEVQRNSSSVSISGVWQMENCLSILNPAKCLQMTSIFWSICWLSHFSRFGWFSLLCFEKTPSLSGLYFVSALLLLSSFGEKSTDVSGGYPMRGARPVNNLKTEMVIFKKGNKKINKSVKSPAETQL